MATTRKAGTIFANWAIDNLDSHSPPCAESIRLFELELRTLMVDIFQM